MKILVSSVLFAIVAGLANAAAAAPGESAGRLTTAHAWSIEQETLMRQFSIGLGVKVPQERDLVALNDRQCTPSR